MSLPRDIKVLTFLMVPNSLLGAYIGIFVAGYLPSSGFPLSYVGIVLGVEGITAITAAIPFGLISDRRGRKNLLVAGNALAGVASLIFFLARNIILYTISALMFGIAEASILSTWNAIIADRTDYTNRTGAFSLTFVVTNVSNSAGSALPFFPFLSLN